VPTAQYDTLKQSFIAGGMPEDLTSALLDEYEENKRRYFLGDYAPGAVNGGRFCEATSRILQFLGNDPHVPLDAEIKVDRALTQIENDMTLEEGLRLHIPRAVRLIYGVRNKRNTGHLKGGIDPSLQDATLVVSVLDWILAELVRIVHGVSAGEAQDMISGIVTKEVPLIEVFNDRPYLARSLKPMDHLLVILYWSGQQSVTKRQLRAWLPPNIAKNLTRYLGYALSDLLVVVDGEEVFLRREGIRYVEANELLKPM